MKRLWNKKKQPVSLQSTLQSISTALASWSHSSLEEMFVWWHSQINSFISLSGGGRTLSHTPSIIFVLSILTSDKDNFLHPQMSGSEPCRTNERSQTFCPSLTELFTTSALPLAPLSCSSLHCSVSLWPKLSFTVCSLALWGRVGN